MTADVENLVLEHLRHLRRTLDFVSADVSDLKLRASAMEHHLGQIQVQMAGLKSRMDRSDERLGRVERRLELVEV